MLVHYLALVLDQIVYQLPELVGESLDYLLGLGLLLHNHPVIEDQLLVLGLAAGLLNPRADYQRLTLRLIVANQPHGHHQLFIARVSKGEQPLALTIYHNIQILVSVEYILVELLYLGNQTVLLNNL